MKAKPYKIQRALFRAKLWGMDYVRVYDPAPLFGKNRKWRIGRR